MSLSSETTPRAVPSIPQPAIFKGESGPAIHGQGDVLLGHFIDPDDGRGTDKPITLSRDRHFHTLATGDTGFGKTVAMQRLVYESTRKWGMRTVVFDHQHNWRRLVHAPGLEGRVRVWTLSGPAAPPLRWNPLQIGRSCDPEVHWRMFCEIFASMAGMGGENHVSEMRAVLYGCYIRAGVLVDDPLVCKEGRRNQNLYGGPPVDTPHEARSLGVQVGAPRPYVNERWWKLDSEAEVRAAQDAWEAKLATGYAPAAAELEAMSAAGTGFPIGELPFHVRQVVGRLRSRAVGLQELLDAVRQRIECPSNGSDQQGYLQGITTHLETLVQGQAAEMFTAGPDVPDICEIVPDPGGVVIVEGGLHMDSWITADLMAWAGWQLHQDAVLAYIEAKRPGSAPLQLVFEGADKIFGGAAERPESVLAEQWEFMWRDSRKYGIFLNAITQKPSNLPEGIVTSSNNVLIAQTKNRSDQETITPHLSGSPADDKGVSRYLGSIPRTEMACRLGYTNVRGQGAPFRMRPLMLDLPVPTDGELRRLMAAGKPAHAETG